MNPTPVQYLEKVSEALGIPIWIKREDLYTLEGVSGSKARKLSAILPTLQSKKITDIITGGTTGSHHIHSTAFLTHKMGIPLHAIFIEQPFSRYAQSVFNSTIEFLDNLYYTRNEWSLSLKAIQLYRKLKQVGRNPYILLPGGSNPAGILAYREAGLELIHSEHASVLQTLDHQICVLGTGGMMAGLNLAKRDDPKLPPLLGVQVYPGIWYGKIYIQFLSSIANKNYNISSYLKNDMKILSHYIENGYGTIHSRYQEAKQLFLKDEILLDPIYSARMALAAIDYSKTFPKSKGLILWYTPPRLDPKCLD